MFDPSDQSRVFGLAPGVDFPSALIEGLSCRLDGSPPQALAQVDLIVNTRRMARRLRDIFDAGPPRLLPRIHLIDSLGALDPSIVLPPATSPLRRRLELTTLVGKLLETSPDLAPRTSLYALSDSLAGLMDEMQGEGITLQDITSLDVSDQSGHWERAQKFIEIACGYLADSAHRPDKETRQRQLVERIAADWIKTPPANPIIVAGSTGSRGTTSLLMQAVARLPQGALVLPGFDFDIPSSVWGSMDEGTPSEDHPQYRFHRLMGALKISCGDIKAWTDQSKPPAPDRNALVSLSLRPAPVTYAWLTEGPNLSDLSAATEKLTLVEAATPREEALAIALRLRKAIAEGRKAALITPDRMLSRQVTSALDRWDILPDDSAGTPLQLSPPGRFLRHVANLFVRKLDAEALLTLLKHPLTHSGGARNDHQLNTQRLELQIRKVGLPYPDVDGVLRLARKALPESGSPEEMEHWAAWVCEKIIGQGAFEELPLQDWVSRHLELVEAIADGSDGSGESELWKQKAGEKAREVMSSLAENAEFGGTMTAADYADLVGALLSQDEVRDRDAPHPDVMIWGTLEARVQGADLVILGGLNDGTWPEAPAPDPWLNRQMRLDAGLLLPERRVGLSAHDYQQAIAAPEVWLTRSIRSDEAETVPSRWLNRLGNLLSGLPDQGGDSAWKDMTDRGIYWLGQVRALEAVERTDPATRPSPRPPRRARPQGLSVTEIKRLIRDPYAIYARHVLRLRALNPLVQSPDAPLRGTIVHEIMEKFVKSVADDPEKLSKTALLETASSVLEEKAPWPSARLMWLARIERIADWFIESERQRQQFASPVAFERAAKGTHVFADLGFKLTGFADRIDRAEDGDVLIYDYKTGTPPSAKEQALFDKQLLLEAAMVEEGGFAEIGLASVKHAAYIGLGSKPVEVSASLTEETPSETMDDLHSLISKYLSEAQGFTARRMVQKDDFAGEYDQLARFGEWDATDEPAPEDLT